MMYPDHDMPRRECSKCKQRKPILGGSFKHHGKGFVCAGCKVKK
jgi:hypothetical protein